MVLDATVLISRGPLGIRLASASDASEVSEFIRLARTADLLEDAAKALSSAYYLDRIVSEHLVCLLCEHGLRIGVLCGVRSECLETLESSEILQHEFYREAVLRAAHQGVGRYCVIDQLIFDHQHRNRGLGARFMEMFCHYIQCPVFIGTLENPISVPRVRIWSHSDFEGIDALRAQAESSGQYASTASPRHSIFWGAPRRPEDE